MTVATVVVNWNSGALLERCIASLSEQTRMPDRVIVVDNASSDDSLDRAQRYLRAAQVIRLEKNVGFARANNIAAQAAHGCDLLALLNPDAVADPGWLEALAAAAEREPAVAGFASQMRLDSAPSVLDGAGDCYHVSGFAWRNGHGVPWADWPAMDTEVFAPCAAAALYRRAAFEEVGGFDERYFCYFEDVDLGFKLRLAGYRCLYVHSAVVYHGGSLLAGYRSNFAVYHTERNVVWTFAKNMPGWMVFGFLPHHFALNVAAVAYYVARGQGKAVLRAKLDALLGLPVAIRARGRVQRTRRASPAMLRRVMSSLKSHPRFHPSRTARQLESGG